MLRWKKQTSIRVRHVLATGSTLEGLIEVSGCLQVDGRVLGEVRSFGPESSLFLGPHGQIIGSVEAEILMIAGHIEGPIRGKNVTLKASAIITGDIQASSLHIEEGAKISGQVTIVPDLVIGPKSKEIPAQHVFVNESMLDVSEQERADEETNVSDLHGLSSKAVAATRLKGVTKHDRQQIDHGEHSQKDHKDHDVSISQ